MAESRNQTINARKRFPILVWVTLLILVLAAACVPVYVNWSRYQEQYRDIISIRMGRRKTTTFTFQKQGRNRKGIPEWSPFADDLANQVTGIRVWLTPDDRQALRTLTKFPNLEQLRLTLESRARLELPKELSDLANVTELTLAADEIGDLKLLAGLTKLRSLTLISRVTPQLPNLTGLKSLAKFELIADRIQVGDWVKQLPQTEDVLLLANRVEQLEALAELKSLDLLAITGDGHELTGLAKLKRLEHLTLHDGSADARDVNAIPGLQRLAVRNCKLEKQNLLSNTIQFITLPADNVNEGWRQACIARWPRAALYLEP